MLLILTGQQPYPKQPPQLTNNPMKSLNSGGNPASSVHQKWVDQGVILAAFCRFRPLNPKKKNQETQMLIHAL